MMNYTSRRSKWIYGKHDLELERESYGILKILQAAKADDLIWETGGSDFHKSEPNLSQDFHHISLGFSDS
jgi:hypothetical protein